MKACIFDLDGTLMDTLDAISSCGNAALLQVGLLPYDRERYRFFVGDGAKRLVERMLQGQDALTPASFDETFSIYNALYNQSPTAKTAPFEGIPALLAALKEKGVALAVLSNKPHFVVSAVIKHFFGEGLFSAVEGQKEGVKIKPDPAGVFRILEALSVKREDCLFIGDSDVDMKTAKAAGLFAVGVSWGFRPKEELREAGADAIIDTPMALLAHI